MENALALPGGRIYLLDGLLQQARSPDELAGILAHELGHVHHRDGMRRLIQTGGTSFLFGLLFGDVTGAGAVIFVGRSMLDASYSRDAERSADAFAIDVMHKLGRSPLPSGDLLFRITGAAGEKEHQHPVQPSADRGAARHDEEGRPRRDRARAVVAGAMDRAQERLQVAAPICGQIYFDRNG